MPGGPQQQVPGYVGTYQWAIRADIKTLATAAIGWGLALIVGGSQRFTSPAWASARLVPGQHLTWGLLFLAAGLLTWCGIAQQWARRLVMAGMLAEVVLFALLTVFMTWSVIGDPVQHTAWTGVVIYLTATVLCATKWQAGHDLRDQ